MKDAAQMEPAEPSHETAMAAFIREKPPKELLCRLVHTNNCTRIDNCYKIM